MSVDRHLAIVLLFGANSGPAKRPRVMLLVLLGAAAALAQNNTGKTHALFDLAQPQGGPFPSDRFSVTDPSHNTGRRVQVPMPDCTARPSDCAEVQVINTLDGFNVQPRLSIAFDGPIEPASVTSRTVFLIRLGSTVAPFGAAGRIGGINQVVWDPATNTLHAESDELLEQHTRYALVVTAGVLDTKGQPVEASEAFRRFRQAVAYPARSRSRYGTYRASLQEAIRAAAQAGIPESSIVVASVFTTQSVTALLEKIRDQLDRRSPAPGDFRLGPDGSRTVFRRDQVTGITLNQQTGANPPRFTRTAVMFSALEEFLPGAVGQIAFGKYVSPDYLLHPGEYFPDMGTLTGTPFAQGNNEVFFNLYLPSGSKPQAGWPVAIFGHGGGNTKDDQSYVIAGSLASRGVATIAITAYGRGGGAGGTLGVGLVSGETVTFPSGGRGFDQDGDGTIGGREGAVALPPREILGERDSQRQTVIDWMQLVRVIRVGMEVDGDGAPDLDGSRIHYFGSSFGGGTGIEFLAVEPLVRVGVLNVPGAAAGRIDLKRLVPTGGESRSSVGSALSARTPPLMTSGGLREIGGVTVGPPYFNENLPLRNQPLVTNDVAGAVEIQEVLERSEWVSQSGDAAAYAPYLRKNPLPGVPAKSVLIQYARGDQLNPNPRNAAVLRAGDLPDRTTFFRNDLAYAENSSLRKDPHGFILRLSLGGLTAELARAAQTQAAAFLGSDGTEIIVPEPKRFFEVPIAPPLPEDLGFIP